MKYLKYFVLFAIIVANKAIAQELYVFSEPASNMAAKSIGVRLTNEGAFRNGFINRTIPEIMVGLNKHLMIHAQGFVSNMHGSYKVEGASLYAKYRFMSLDANQAHTRAAVFGRLSSSNRRIATEDINLEGDNSGWQSGLVITQLIHKLALSGTFSYSRVFDKYSEVIGGRHPKDMIGYSLSSGYLMLPFVYENYNQPNFNLYFEVLGKTNPANGHSYIDFAPALQLILNSRTRIDLGYRFQVTGNIQDRYLKNMYLARLELNFFNALR